MRGHIVKLTLLVVVLFISGCNAQASLSPATQTTVAPSPTHTRPAPTGTPKSTATPKPTLTVTLTPTTRTVSTIQPTITSGPDWDYIARRRFVPRTLKELTLLSASTMKSTISMGNSEKGIFINIGDDLASRIAVNFTGRFREMPELSRVMTILWQATSGSKKNLEEAKDWYTTEGLFVEDGVEYWLPIRTDLISNLNAEAKEGTPIVLYVTLIGYHRADDQTTWVFPVNEFLVPKEISDESNVAPVFCPSENEEAQFAYDQANDLRDLEKFAEAEKLYRKAIELDPNYCDAMDNLGVMLRRQDRVNETIQWYQRSLKVKPDNTLALQNMGFAYKEQEKWDKAIQAYEKLIQIAPDNPEGHYGLGESYYLTQKYQEAIAPLEIAEWLYFHNGSPGLKDAQYYLGISYFWLKDYLRARGYLAPIYSQGPDDIRINVCLGISYLNAEPKDLELAKKYLLKAEELGYELPEDWVKVLVNVFGTWPPP